MIIFNIMGHIHDAEFFLIKKYNQITKNASLELLV